MKATIFKKNQPVQITITELKNITINKDLFKSSPSSKSLHQIEFLEFSDHGIALELPKGMCGLGNHILLVLQTKNAGRDFSFNCTVKVTQIEDLDNNKTRADLKLLQFD